MTAQPEPLETMFGTRQLYVVEYPSTMTAYEMVVFMNWAKSHDVLYLAHDVTTIACRVKPRYAHHFEKNNKEYIVPYELKDGFIKVRSSIYGYE